MTAATKPRTMIITMTKVTMTASHAGGMPSETGGRTTGYAFKVKADMAVKWSPAIPRHMRFVP